jgi:pyrroloquinoline quinone biosynthesis protein B
VRLIVLGAAAGGGFPQWNCACVACRGVRQGHLQAMSRTQTSVAISADGQRWFLLAASPDIRTQIEATPQLHPQPPRRSPIAGLVLTDAELDGTLGLFSLREGHPLAVYATAAVRAAVVDGNVMARTLFRGERHVQFAALELGKPIELLDAQGVPMGLEVTAVPVPGKVPVHLEDQADDPELHVGLMVRDLGGEGSLAYFPSVARVTPEVEAAARRASVVLWDGTLWSDDELLQVGVGRTGRQLAHWSLGGNGGSLAFLSRLPARRRLLVHVNNTNPVLLEDSAERRALTLAGIEVAEDGQELSP